MNQRELYQRGYNACKRAATPILEKIEARCDRDDKLIFQMKDEISQLKMKVNSLSQKLKSNKT